MRFLIGWWTCGEDGQGYWYCYNVAGCWVRDGVVEFGNGAGEVCWDLGGGGGS